MLYCGIISLLTNLLKELKQKDLTGVKLNEQPSFTAFIKLFATKTTHLT